MDIDEYIFFIVFFFFCSPQPLFWNFKCSHWLRAYFWYFHIKTTPTPTNNQLSTNADVFPYCVCICWLSFFFLVFHQFSFNFLDEKYRFFLLDEEKKKNRDKKMAANEFEIVKLCKMLIFYCCFCFFLLLLSFYLFDCFIGVNWILFFVKKKILCIGSHCLITKQSIG